jgi:hypothetical protein
VCRLAVAGFCHEVRLRFDSAMPTGCAGGLAGARRNGRPGKLTPASGRLVARKCINPESFSTTIAKIVTARG